MYSTRWQKLIHHKNLFRYDITESKKSPDLQCRFVHENMEIPETDITSYQVTFLSLFRNVIGFWETDNKNLAPALGHVILHTVSCKIISDHVSNWNNIKFPSQRCVTLLRHTCHHDGIPPLGRMTVIQLFSKREGIHKSKSKSKSKPNWGYIGMHTQAN